MTETVADLSFNAGQNWHVSLTARDEDGEVLPLLSGVQVEFRLSELKDGEVTSIITKSILDGVTVTDGPAGKASIVVSSSDQLEAEVSASGVYFYEIRTIVGDQPLMQARGGFKVAGSLFSTGSTDPMLAEFRLRFPEIDDEDDRILLFMGDARSIVSRDSSWATVADRNRAILYLTAHLMFTRKVSSSQFESSGGAATGAVKSISVEDRSVSFETGSSSSSSSSSTSGLNLKASGYGAEYLAMLRRRTVYLDRA